MGVLALLSIQFGKTEGAGIVITQVSLEVREPCSPVWPDCNRTDLQWWPFLKKEVRLHIDGWYYFVWCDSV
jgi:hypothetical protein